MEQGGVGSGTRNRGKTAPEALSPPAGRASIAYPLPAMSDDLHATLPPWPERFNLCEYFLDRNLDEGRGDKAALYCAEETDRKSVV